MRDGDVARRLECEVLALLSRREMYGVEIVAGIGAAGARDGELAAGIPEGSIYPVLRRLERTGLAFARWVEVGALRPRRRYYSLTAKGQRMATVAQRRPAHPVHA